MDGGSKEEVKDHCIRALSRVGVDTQVCHFYADILMCEYDMTHSIYRMQKELRDEMVRQPLDSALLFAVMQNMTKKFYYWKKSIDALTDQGTRVPPLNFNAESLSHPQIFKALCSLETNEMNLHEGEELVVTDTTSPNRLRVRNSKGEEGYVPALCCILPTPDNSAVTAVERLQVHLLTSWTECVRRVKSLLFDNLMTICRSLASTWSSSHCQRDQRDRERVARRFKRLFDAATVHTNGLDINRLHSALFSLEKELTTLTQSDLSAMIVTVANLDKAVLCYQNFHRQWRHYRHTLKSAPRPIRIVEQLDHLRQVAHGKNFKYYEMKMTLEDTEVVEEITYINNVSSPKREKQVLRGGTGARHEAVATEQLTTSSQEEQRRFIIRAIVDPRDGLEISMHDAIQAGIINQRRGIYVDPTTGTETPIPLAMTDGLIKVEYVATTRSAEKKSALGLITIRTQIDKREYAITGAWDALTAEKISLDEARLRGIIDDRDGLYIVGTTGEELALVDAIEQGWVFVEYEPETGEPEFEVNIYAVSEVVDQLLKMNVPFAEALHRGLIDRDTGDYINNLTRESVPVADAIRRGLLKARLIDDVSALQVDKKNALVVQRIDKIRKNVLKGLRVISAFKQGVQKHNESV